MAEATVLICDLCRRERPAVTRKSLDVCAQHDVATRKLHERRHTRTREQPGEENAIERKRRIDRERKREKYNYQPRVRRDEQVHVHGEAKAKRAMRIGPPTTKSGRYGNGHAPWTERMALVASLLPSVGYMDTVELEKRVKAKAAEWVKLQMSDSNYGLVLRRLKAKGMIAQKGSRRYASYARAEGGGNGKA